MEVHQRILRLQAVEAHAKDKKVRRLARVVARAGTAGCRPQVESLLSHKDQRVRSEAARALGLLGSPESKESLLKALADPGPYVRIEAVTALGRVLPRIARAVMAASGATAYNVLQNNGRSAHQAVFHVHFHIIPKYAGGKGLEIGWKPDELEDGAALAKSIADAIG